METWVDIPNFPNYKISNGDRVHISECLRGMRKSHKGLRFNYFWGVCPWG
jgi:hypothetical protein